MLGLLLPARLASVEGEADATVMKSGSVLGGKYRLISLLGSGGMGSVWRAEHLGLKAPVAVKLLASDLDGRQDSIARFLREAQSAASLRSPHVVQILDHGVDEATQTPFIAMELMEGESLADRLLRVRRISPNETAKVITQAARALTRAQEFGIIHRDLKPANLFLVRNEDDELLKVLDFGLAKWRRPPGALTQGAATATNLVMGTPYYMSPEQMNGSRDADLRSDLWALGVIAYECLTGTRPFDADNLIAIALKVCTEPAPALSPALGLPPELDGWFSRALAKQPADRFQSARELSEAFRRACHVENSASASWPGPGVAVASPAASSVPESAGAAVAQPLQPLAQHATGASPYDGYGHTASLVHVPLGEPAPQASLAEGASSSQPVARSIDVSPVPARRAGGPRQVAAVLGVGGVLAALALTAAARHHASEPAAQPAQVAAQVAQPALQPSLAPPTTSLAPRTASLASPSPLNLVEPTVDLPGAGALSGAPVVTVAPADAPSAVSSAGSAPTPPNNVLEAEPKASSSALNAGAAAARQVTPTRRPTPREQPSSSPVNIERKPSF